MAAYEHPSFHYHAEAHAFSGEFVRPVRHTIEVQAGTSLPFTGGHGQVQVDDYRVQNLLSLKKAYTHVSGSKSPTGKYTSHSTAVVEALNLLEMVTADRVVARLTSEHGPQENEGHVITLGSTFENLRIAGCQVQVELDHEMFLAHQNYDALRKQLAAMKKSGRMAVESRGVILCSLVKSLKLECPGVEVQGHTITIQHFGKVFLGELLVEPGSKRLSMLRLQLGSPHEGQLVLSAANSNGRTWP